MGELANQFSAIFRDEHRAVRDEEVLPAHSTENQHDLGKSEDNKSAVGVSVFHSIGQGDRSRGCDEIGFATPLPNPLIPEA